MRKREVMFFEHREFEGSTFIMERGIRADLGLVKAWKGVEDLDYCMRRALETGPIFFERQRASAVQGSVTRRRRARTSTR